MLGSAIRNRLAIRSRLRRIGLLAAFLPACGSDSGNKPPVANAGSDQSVEAGAMVTLDGSRSRDPEGHALAFAWTQLNGPTVPLTGDKSAMATFVSPTDGTTLTFQLSVSDDVSSSTNVTHVTVRLEDASASVTELSQGIPVQSSTRPGNPSTWLVTTPDLPTLPAEESEIAEFTESYDEHGVVFLPIVEQRLAAGATRTLSLPLVRPSGLCAYAQWLGTDELLKATLDLDGGVLARGIPYAFGGDRGGTLIQVMAPKDGLARFSVTNTSGTSIQVRMALASSVQ
ncbi:MAG TPA: PKD domain-containing protein [Polyangiaceae bacterium]